MDEELKRYPDARFAEIRAGIVKSETNLLRAFQSPGPIATEERLSEVERKQAS
jgi:hypothetical protein